MTTIDTVQGSRGNFERPCIHNEQRISETIIMLCYQGLIKEERACNYDSKRGWMNWVAMPSFFFVTRDKLEE